MATECPPGQFVTKKFPVLTYGATPQIDLSSWQLRIFGLVEQELTLNWEEFKALPCSTVEADFHCVTRWSALENRWEGVLFSELTKLVKPKPEADYIMAHCYGGYTTNMAVEAALEGSGILAHRRDGVELPRDLGWPVRLVIPNRYGWKSAKWLNGIEFMDHDKPGFWEQGGYSNNADPWNEERFWPELAQSYPD